MTERITERASKRAVAQGWRVRAAVEADAPHVADAVAQLLTELGANPPALAAMQETARALIVQPQAGALLVAEAHAGGIVGVLGASAQLAIHVPGRYLLIQDLWVHPAWRSQAIGAALLAAVEQLAHDQGMARLEVGLPRPEFARIRATQAFYQRNGFTLLGVRMRRVLQ
jgi:GNAT superfamily N-acetyltransferase